MATVSWVYLVVGVSNKGRKVTENGKIAKSHTKKSDMTALPRNMWNAKGKKMMTEAKGGILNAYGSKGWELVGVNFEGEPNENTYIFKRKK